uniref:Uncharacterized protein n=1 Tax=Opuntia streptacantha TaxID=393608 RepID=A0A7C9DBR4_OPUST
MSWTPLISSAELTNAGCCSLPILPLWTTKASLLLWNPSHVPAEIGIRISMGTWMFSSWAPASAFNLKPRSSYKLLGHQVLPGHLTSRPWQNPCTPKDGGA